MKLSAKAIDKAIDKAIELWKIKVKAEKIQAQNQELIRINHQLLENLNKVNKVLEPLTNFSRQVREERLLRIQKRKNRKRREQSNPIQIEHYKRLLEVTGNSMEYTSVRMRLSLTLLFITGVIISELRPFLL